MQNMTGCAHKAEASDRAPADAQRLEPDDQRWFRRGASLALALVIAAGSPIVANAADVLEPRAEDGSFPTPEEVGGEVFPAGIQPGDAFPMDVQLYDSEGTELTLGDIASGKRTLLTFFITAAPVSVAELGKIENFAKGKDINVVFANSDFVGTALLKGSDNAVSETVRTLHVVKEENNLDTPLYVAPNNVYAPGGLSNRLGFRGLPTSYVIGEDGKIVTSYVGPREWGEGDLMDRSAANAAGTGASDQPEGN